MLQFHPLTPDRWSDLETLFGERGAYSGCWCMFWRLRRSKFARTNGPQRKAALKKLTDRDHPPGLLAYSEGTPVAWVCLDKREAFPALEYSRLLKPLDNKPVWSLVCFFVAKPWRRQGLMVELISGAVQYAEQQGATIVEAYPTELGHGILTAVPLQLTGYSGYMGIASAFQEAGFEVVKRVSKTQVMMRHIINKTSEVFKTSDVSSLA